MITILIPAFFTILFGAFAARAMHDSWFDRGDALTAALLLLTIWSCYFAGYFSK